MSYTSRQAAQESQQVERSANKVVSPKFTDQRASTSVQLKQQQLMQTAHSPAQLAAEEEEPLQGKFVAQRVEEEELLQGKFVAQRAEEEELLQGKFATAQLAGIEEEEPIQGKFSNTATAQLEEKPNNTGLPNQLKSGIESLSGMSLDGVKVHYNSDKPAQLNAHAYAQGTDIHVAPGQEQHLPHEAWHVVQQAQGRVKPTTQMKGTSVNDDVGLETEADVMGAKALNSFAGSIDVLAQRMKISPAWSNAVQLRAVKTVSPSARRHYGSDWATSYGIGTDTTLKANVPNSVTGEGEIDLGIHWGTTDEGRDVRKRCKIGYGDYRYPGGQGAFGTKIYHCGPSGPHIPE